MVKIFISKKQFAVYKSYLKLNVSNGPFGNTISFSQLILIVRYPALILTPSKTGLTPHPLYCRFLNLLRILELLVHVCASYFTQFRKKRYHKTLGFGQPPPPLSINNSKKSWFTKSVPHFLVCFGIPKYHGQTGIAWILNLCPNKIPKHTKFHL